MAFKVFKVLALLKVFVLAGFGLDGLALRDLGFEGLELQKVDPQK